MYISSYFALILFILLEANHLKIYTEATKSRTLPHRDTEHWFLHCSPIPTKINITLGLCWGAQCTVWDLVTTRTQWSFFYFSVHRPIFSGTVRSSVYKKQPRKMTRRETQQSMGSVRWKKKSAAWTLKNKLDRWWVVFALKKLEPCIQDKCTRQVKIPLTLAMSEGKCAHGDRLGWK